MPENSNISLSDAKVAIKDKDGNWMDLSKVASGKITIEPLTGDAPEWDLSKSDADLCFSFNGTIDKRTRRKLKKMVGKPLKIRYGILRPLQRVSLWCIVHWAKLFHLPFAISVGSGRLIVCKDINEML